MKKIIQIFLMIFLATAVYAEDVLQVVPFKAQPGSTSDDACYFSIKMNNTVDVWAFQFDILLPEGMYLDNTDGLGPFELSGRCPYTTGRGGVKKWKHSVQYSLLDNGWYRVVVFTTDVDRIKGSSGEVLRAYYITDADMAEGIQPIKIRSSVMTISGNCDIKPDDSSSYCIIGNWVLQNGGVADFTSLNGYIPSWVVTSIAEELASAEDLTALDIRNADILGCNLALPNPNALCYVKHDTVAQNITTGNAVVCSDGYYCEKLNLYDGNNCFYSSYDVECVSASFDREFQSALWSTVVLPFDVDEKQVSALKKNGVSVEKLVSYNAGNNTLYFEPVESMLANVPYIIKCGNTMTPFAEVAVETFASSADVGSVSCDGIAMTGNYGNIILNSDEVNKYYVYNAMNGEFVIVGENSKILPFHAYISIPTAIGDVMSISVSHIDDGSTSIDGCTMDSAAKQCIYTIYGAKVGETTVSSNLVQGLAKGIYVVGSKKIIIK